MSQRAVLAAAVASSLAGCAHGQAQAPGRSAPSSNDNPAELVSSTIALVQEVRGLRALTPIAVQMLEPKAFAVTLGEHLKSDHAELERLRASWVAFGLVPPSLDLSATIRDVLDEQILGFYDPKTKALFVRSGKPAMSGPLAEGPAAALMTRAALAHEIEHALQDQLLIHLNDTPSDEEASLARTALIEGDAQLTMLAVIAKLQGQPLEQALGNITMMTKMGPDVLAQMSGFSSKLLEAPLVLRETLTFPYIAGLKFAGALWQAGGFALVDRAFHAPPLSAAQILHPGRYSKDLEPRPVPEFALPAGWLKRDSGSAGELGTLSVLDQCLSRPRAEAGAARLLGDHYLIGERPDGKLGLLWLSVWPTRKAADKFVIDIVEGETCWDKTRGDGKGAVGPEVQIRIAGSDKADPPAWVTVEVLRGVPLADANRVTGVLEKIAPEPAPTPKPPLGEGLALKPVAPAVPEAHHGTLSGAAWSDEGLGLAATVPPDWIARTNVPGVALLIASPSQSRDNGVYGYIPAPLDPALTRQLVGALTASFEAAVGGGKKLHAEGEGPITREGATGVESRWSLSDTDLDVRIRLLPVCDGRATAMLATFAQGRSVAALGQWMESFRIGPAGSQCPTK